VIRIERNPAPSAATLALSYVGACVMGFAISALLIAATGYDPAEALGPSGRARSDRRRP